MKIFKFLNVFLKSFTHKKISYSFGGMDSLIEKIFTHTNNGIYVDIGCGHPIKNNNTYLLHKRGWSGVNIDLDDDNIELFDLYRSNDHNISAAISNNEKEVDLFFYHSKSAINTINKATANYQSATVTQVKKIKTTTLNSILDNSKFRNLNIDFLTIDVEGSELLVLENFNFNKYKPKNNCC